MNVEGFGPEQREALRRALVDATAGCFIQFDGWPCNSCFHAMDLGVDPMMLHGLWEAVLAFRGDYDGYNEDIRLGLLRVEGAVPRPLPEGDELRIRLLTLARLLSVDLEGR